MLHFIFFIPLRNFCSGGRFVECRKAVRATLILIPLLGLQYVLFPMRPQHDGRLKHIHNLTVAVVTSLQVVTACRYFVCWLFSSC